MRRIIIILLFIILNNNIDAQVSQIYYNNLYSQANQWTVERVNRVVDSIVLDYYFYQQKRIVSSLEYAEKHCFNPIMVFHAKIEWDTYWNNHDLILYLENSDLPLDYYFVDKRLKTKLVLLTYHGIIELIGPLYPTGIKRMAHRMNNALRLILKRTPDLVFVCDNLPFCYMYLKDGDIFIYDCYSNDNVLIQEYNRIKEMYDLSIIDLP